MGYLRKLKATLLGYYWLPCPLCGEWFGGFEAGDGILNIGDGRASQCCKKCDYYAGIIAGSNNDTVYVPGYVAEFIKKPKNYGLPVGRLGRMFGFL